MFLVMTILTSVLILSDSEESDAANGGQMNVYIYDGLEWFDYVGMRGYNALQALQATKLDIVADTTYILRDSTINPDYGKVTSIDGVTSNSTYVWNVYTYSEADGWQVAVTPGFITPFADRSHRASTVVFYYGSEDSYIPANVYYELSDKNLGSLINPVGDENYAMEFYLKIDVLGFIPNIRDGTSVTYLDEDYFMWDTKELTEEDLKAGITVKGYGSNAYTALVNAIGENNIDWSESLSLFRLCHFDLGSRDVFWRVSYSNDYSSYSTARHPLGCFSVLENVPSDPSDSTDFRTQWFTLIYTESSDDDQIIAAIDDPTLGYRLGYDRIPVLQTYSLAFDANGGSGAPSTQSKETYATSIEMAIPDQVPVNGSLTFLGWSTSPDATRASYQPGSSIYLYSSTTTLYAVWATASDLVFSSNPVTDGEVIWRG